MKIAFLFQSAPHGTSIAREGLDALLAATAFCAEDQIGVFFINDGVLNLLKNQQTDAILQKDFSRMFNLLDLYEIEQRFLCEESLAKFQLTQEDLLISAKILPRRELFTRLAQAEKILTF